MSENLRVKSSQYIDETTRVSFKFNGTTYYGFKGDTLASALLANNVHLVGRSFKYHRPRGIMTAVLRSPMQLFKLIQILIELNQMLGQLKLKYMKEWRHQVKIAGQV